MGPWKDRGRPNIQAAFALVLLLIGLFFIWGALYYTGGHVWPPSPYKYDVENQDPGD